MTQINLQEKPEINTQASFTTLQAVMLIIGSILVSVTAWYIAGVKFFWNDIDMQRVNQQLEYFEQKVEAEPNNLDYKVSLGYTYFLKGENDKAKKEFNTVLELDKNYFDAYYNLGLVYAYDEQLDEALEMFDKATQIAPRDYKGHMQLGITYRKLGMYDEAMKALTTASKLAPGNAAIVYEIGMVAEVDGDKDIAIEIYKEALAYDPLFQEAIEGLKRLE